MYKEKIYMDIKKFMYKIHKIKKIIYRNIKQGDSQDLRRESIQRKDIQKINIQKKEIYGKRIYKGVYKKKIYRDMIF